MNPILYATSQQPHCRRARLALTYARLPVAWKEVAAEHSAEGVRPPSGANGVPFLQLEGGERLGTSMEILHWAVLKNDPDGWIDFEVDVLDAMHDLVRINDSSFANDLACYRETAGARRERHRRECELFLKGLERRLARTPYLFDERVSFADAAILPFVQGFARVEPQWFARADYRGVRGWLGRMGTAVPDLSSASEPVRN